MCTETLSGVKAAKYSTPPLENHRHNNCKGKYVVYFRVPIIAFQFCKIIFNYKNF